MTQPARRGEINTEGPDLMREETVTDDELTALAAKTYDDAPDGFSPLTDDADAFRLAAALEMNVFHAAQSAYALPSDDDGTYEEQVRYIDAGGDKCAATRRAIVRAAAEIGRGMKDDA